MSAVAMAEEEIYDSGFGKRWWIFLITGTAWLILSLVIFRFDITSVKSIGVLAGIIFLFAGIMDLIIAFSNRTGLWWLRMISGFLCIGLAFWASGEFGKQAYLLL